MNKEKIYACIGAILGAGVVLGVGFAPASWVATLVEEVDGRMPLGTSVPLLLVFFLVMVGVPAMAWRITNETGAVVFLFVSLFSLGAFANTSGWLSSLFLLMPFAGLAGATGYRHGGSIGEKARWEKRHREAKEREETQHIEAEKAEIIDMIEKALKGQGGEQR